MIFTQPVFLVFFAMVFGAYWWVKSDFEVELGKRLRVTGHECRLSILLLASAVFYGWWDWRFLGLISLVIFISWLAALKATKLSPGSTGRRAWLIFAIGSNLAVLAAFKYFGFFAVSAAETLRAIGLEPSWPAVNLLLPVGISFYIFQAISYVVDTARGDLAAERRIRRVALYIAFFPQLVAGPIVRATSFFPQMERAKHLSAALVASGGRAFLIGFAYKAGIADNLAPLVDPVYGGGELSVWSNSALIGATLAFGGQIYFDFAGYSLMAIGVARLFGFHIPKNFDYPYAALSIADFWRRWHISLSSWLRDYLYIPLGGNRGGELATYRNLMTTMVLGGLWHGAAWTFVAWGALHGSALVVHRAVFGSMHRAISSVLAFVLTQGFVLLTWAAFRAESFSDMASFWYAFTSLRAGGGDMLPWFVWLVPGLVALDALLGLRGRKWFRGMSVLRRPSV
ncbi:MAG: MBOAT family O-acyltransferase, partial [Pseudomonadota bacterium]